MHVDGRPTNKYPQLDQLSTEELKRLLRAADGDEPDVDFILQAMEVIRSRESCPPGAPQTDMDAEWDSFKEDYLGHADDFSTDPPTTNFKPRKAPRFLRRVLIVAAILAVLVGTASALRLDFFQAVARWGAETFHFTALDAIFPGQATLENDPYAELRETVARYTDTAVIPTWAPEGTTAITTLEVLERQNCIDIRGQYNSSLGEFSIHIQVFDRPPEIDDTTYQKDNGEIDVIEHGGITHYLFSNLDFCGVTWVSENTKCYIQGKLTPEDLSHMISSIYRE